LPLSTRRPNNISVVSPRRPSGTYRINSNHDCSIGEPAMTRDEAWNLANL
jgi:hypothetical protein